MQEWIHESFEVSVLDKKLTILYYKLDNSISVVLSANLALHSCAHKSWRTVYQFFVKFTDLSILSKVCIDNLNDCFHSLLFNIDSFVDHL